MTLEQTRQQWYNEQIFILLSLNNKETKWYKHLFMKAYMKLKMEQQLKKGK